MEFGRKNRILGLSRPILEHLTKGIILVLDRRAERRLREGFGRRVDVEWLEAAGAFIFFIFVWHAGIGCGINTGL